jgi:hypothetical protein
MDRGAVAEDDQAVPLASCSTWTDNSGTPVEEIPAKCKPTDFTICIICQEEPMKYKLSKPRDLSSYETFLQSVNKRSEFGNPDFVKISHRFVGLTAAHLLSKGAQWHRNCYSDATNKSNTERDERKYHPSNTVERTRTKCAGRPSDIRLTRSVCPMFDRNECFFCQGKDVSKVDEVRHACQSESVAKSIQDIIHNSDNDSWKVQLADIIAEGDFLARDIVYHSSCKVTYWRKYVQGPKRSSTGNEGEYAALLSAEIEFYDELLESIESGEYVTTVDAETLYRNMMRDHGVDHKSITRRTVVKKISDNMPNIVLAPNKGNLPGIFHSKKAGREALDTANIARDIKGDLNAIFKCAKIIRGVISNSRKETPWSFTGSLGSSSQGDVPLELMMMNRWILQGSKAATTESRDHVLQKSCTVISQTMMQEFKSRRQMAHKPKSESAASLFRRRLESPFAVGLSLWMYHNLRSQKAITVLSNMCTGISYSRVTHVCSQIANAVLENINANGVFVPYGIVKGRAIRASADNVDKKVDTYDGKNSFHAMASSVYQPTCDGETLVEALDLYKVSPGALVDVPVTCIQLIPCDVTGNPKPRTSPCYMSYRVGFHEAHYEKSLKHDIAWMMARYLNRSSQCPLSVSSQQTDVGLSGMTTIPADTIAINDSDQLPDLACDTTSDIDDQQTTVVDDSTPSTMTETEKGPGEQPVSSMETNQRIPVWSAYNSISTQQTSLTIDKSYSLPIINAPAHEWPTLVTTLDQLSRLNDLVSGGDKLVVTFDMDLYKRVLRLEHLDSRYKDKLMVCPGAFHTSLCALRCLGRTIEGSGIDDAWLEADMYSSVTVNQIINGNHYSRAVEAHEITLQVFFDLWLEAFFTEKPAVRAALEDSVQQLSSACESKQGVHEAHMALLVTIESLNLNKQLADFDARHCGHPMFQWARMYMRQVMTLLQFHRSTRQGDWFLHLSSLEKLCMYFFAYDRLDYAQNTPEYVARMYQLQTVDPDIWNRFLSGEFTVNSSNTIPFTRLGVDQAQEQENKTLKGQGAINGITQSPATLLKFCMCAPELARIANETEKMIGMPNLNRTVHHRLNQPTVRRQEQAIANLTRVLKPCDIFTSDETHMFKLMTKEILPKEIEESILATERRGSTAMNTFVKERICGDTNLWDKMTKCKPLLWNSSTKEIKLQAKSEVLTLRATTGLMSRLLIIARSTRDVDLEDVIGNYEFSITNRTLMTATGSVHPTLDKSEVIAFLENMPDQDAENMGTAELSAHESDHGPAASNKCLIVDGMAVVQELMAVRSFENCLDLSNAYVKLINAKACNYHVSRVVFDNYSITESLKETTRERRRGGKKAPVGYQVNDSTKIKDRNTFLGSNTTKDSLTLYLAQKLIDNAQVDIITATHKDVMSNRSGDITPGVSSQEEADTLMIFHAVEAAKAGYIIHIYSQDTDVLLAALRRVPLLGEDAAMVMGTSDKRRLVMLKPIYNALGENKARALCKWHALTGCDTTGHIRGKSKIACLKAFLTADPSSVAAISALGVGSEPSDETINGCVSFLCSLFCKKGITISQPHILRWSLFKQQGIDKGVEMLPPTSGAWIQHIRRAHCQSAIWEQDLILHPIVPDPLKLGWIKEDNCLVPNLSDIAPAPTTVVELVKCRCGSSKPNATSACTTARCSCLAHGLVCTELCWCEGVDICQNSSPSGD